MLKCSEQELVIIRYSTPKSVMRLHRENSVLVTTPTLVGLRHLQTQTGVYELDTEQQYLKIRYQLK